MLARIVKLATLFAGCKLMEPILIPRTIDEDAVQHTKLLGVSWLTWHGEWVSNVERESHTGWSDKGSSNQDN